MIFSFFLFFIISSPGDDQKQAPPALQVIEFNNPIGQPEHQWLESHADFRLYLGENRYLIKMKKGSSLLNESSKAMDSTPLRSVSEFKKESKVSHRLQTFLQDNKTCNSILIWVQTLPGESDHILLWNPAAVLQKITFPHPTDLLKIRAANLDLQGLVARLLDDPAVLWVDLANPMSLMNDQSVWVCQSGLTGQGMTPLFDHGVNGQGVVVGFLDTGVDADSCYFYDNTEGLPGETLNLDQRKIIAYQDFGSEGNWHPCRGIDCRRSGSLRCPQHRGWNGTRCQAGCSGRWICSR